MHGWVGGRFLCEEEMGEEVTAPSEVEVVEVVGQGSMLLCGHS